MNRFDYGNQLKKLTKVELLEECRKLNVFDNSIKRYSKNDLIDRCVRVLVGMQNSIAFTASIVGEYAKFKELENYKARNEYLYSL